nr:serine/threonine-protein kinase [Azospirillum sp. SYSU D00513]
MKVAPARPVQSGNGAVPILEEAEPCRTLADFHGPGGRTVLGNILRRQLDSQWLTPTELIHNSRALRPLLEQRELIGALIARIAAAQARQSGQTAAERHAAIEGALEQTVARAADAQLAFARTPNVRSAVDTLLLLGSERSPTGNAGYDCRVALSLDLSGVRGWGAKLDRLLQLIQPERREELTAAVDDVIGDLLASPGAMQELFGTGSTQTVLLLNLCDLVLGRIAVGRAGPDRMGVLNGLFRQGKLPVAQAAVLDRLRRHLRSPQPLAPGQPQLEGKTLQALLANLLTPAGMAGGGPMAEALTIRFARRLEEQGSADALQRAVWAVCRVQADLVCTLHYLAALATAPLAARLMADIVGAFDQALGNEALVEAMVFGSADTELVRDRLKAAVAAIESSGLPGPERARIAGRALHIVDEYAQRGRLGRHLLAVEPVPRRRAIRLAELACSGIVRDGGALPLMRQNIMEIVRHPSFQGELSSRRNDTIVQAELKRLHELLDRLRQGSRTLSQPQRRTGETLTVTAGVAAMEPQASPPDSTPPAQTASPPQLRCQGCFAVLAGVGPCGLCGYPARMENRRGIHLAPGTGLKERYRTGGILGQGGFGATYIGWDERHQARVAIKEYYPANLIARAVGTPQVTPFSDEHAQSFAAGLAKFFNEAQLLAQLRDIKGVVAVRDCFKENGTAYLVMELLEGPTLKRCVTDNGGRLDLRRAMAILTPVMATLQTVHDRGLIHRDVSPDNIVITPSDGPKLLDFGAARTTAARPGLQAANFTVILKPGYAPPEQYAEDGHQGPWTDVYALCATFYRALTGKVPPDATTRFLSDKVPALGEFGVVAPRGLEATLMAGLCMRHQDRPQSMRELLAAFGRR